MDGFGEHFQFMLPHGQHKMTTWCGLFFTVTAIVIILFYAAMNLIKLLEFREPTIMMSVRDSYLDTDFEFTSEQGLRFAFALTAYDENQEPIEDPSYGQVKAYYKSWGIKDSNNVDFEELPTVYCTRA